MVCGVLSVMISGPLLMPMWLADSWATLEQVRLKQCICYNFRTYDFNTWKDW